MKRPKHKASKKRMDKLVDQIIIANILFTLAVLALNWFDHLVSDSLIVGWFGFWGIQLINMRRIKINGDRLTTITQDYKEEQQ